MWSSLINDVYYKNKLYENLLEISEIIFDNKILENYSEWKNKKSLDIENWFNNVFWLSDKKIDKTIKKIRNKKHILEVKLKNESNKTIIKNIKNEIDVINYTLEKYK